MVHLSMYKQTIFLFCLLTSILSVAQDGEDLFSMLDTPIEAPPLLPERMMVTQKLLWGEKGILRTSGIAPLTMEQRQKELKLRRTLLTTHQVLGYTTLAAMVAQGIIGGKLYNGDNSLYQLHKDMGTAVNIGYFTTAGLSLFAPPPLINKKVKGFSSIKAHKTLATVHFSAMLVTNIYKDKNRDIHKSAAYTAFGSYAMAVLVFKF
jgi:cytochrome b561